MMLVLSTSLLRAPSINCTVKGSIVMLQEHIWILLIQLLVTLSIFVMILLPTSHSPSVSLSAKWQNNGISLLKSLWGFKKLVNIFCKLKIDMCWTVWNKDLQIWFKTKLDLWFTWKGEPLHIIQVWVWHVSLSGIERTWLWQKERCVPTRRASELGSHIRKSWFQTRPGLVAWASSGSAAIQ